MPGWAIGLEDGATLARRWVELTDQHVLIDDSTIFGTTTSPQRNLDVASGGDRFVFVEPDRDESTRARIEFLLNWTNQPLGDGN